MDMDDVCSAPIRINLLKKYIENDENWDSLSFNRNIYYDIWALSIDSYLLSCWHFHDSIAIAKMIQYVKNKLFELNENELLECRSAFNGFAIYKKSKFVDCFYDWEIKNTYNLITEEEVKKNEKEVGLSFTLNKSYHSMINPLTDCEHRYFHMKAIEKNNAKIRISPLNLFEC